MPSLVQDVQHSAHPHTVAPRGGHMPLAGAQITTVVTEPLLVEAPVAPDPILVTTHVAPSKHLLPVVAEAPAEGLHVQKPPLPI